MSITVAPYCERSEAIQSVLPVTLDCFAALAMTEGIYAVIAHPPTKKAAPVAGSGPFL